MSEPDPDEWFRRLRREVDDEEERAFRLAGLVSLISFAVITVIVVWLLLAWLL